MTLYTERQPNKRCCFPYLYEVAKFQTGRNTRKILDAGLFSQVRNVSNLWELFIAQENGSSTSVSVWIWLNVYNSLIECLSKPFNCINPQHVPNNCNQTYWRWFFIQTFHLYKPSACPQQLQPNIVTLISINISTRNQNAQATPGKAPPNCV